MTSVVTTTSEPAGVLRVGDVMRFSIELLQVIRDEGDATQRVVVREIQRTPDGTVTLWLSDVDPASGPGFPLLGARPCD